MATPPHLIDLSSPINSPLHRPTGPRSPRSPSSIPDTATNSPRSRRRAGTSSNTTNNNNNNNNGQNNTNDANTNNTATTSTTTTTIITIRDIPMSTPCHAPPPPSSTSSSSRSSNSTSASVRARETFLGDLQAEENKWVSMKAMEERILQNASYILSSKGHVIVTFTHPPATKGENPTKFQAFVVSVSKGVPLNPFPKTYDTKRPMLETLERHATVVGKAIDISSLENCKMARFRALEALLEESERLLGERILGA